MWGDLCLLDVEVLEFKLCIAALSYITPSFFFFRGALLLIVLSWLMCKLTWRSPNMYTSQTGKR